MAEENVAIQEPSAVEENFDIDVLLQRFSDDPIFEFDLDLDLLRDSWVPESDLPANVLHSSGSSSPVPPTSVDSPPLDPGSPDSFSSFVNYIESFLMEDVDWGDGGLITSKGDVEEGQRKEKEAPEAVLVVEEDEGFVSKKRRRQMRNRESAMISRERKKMYVKDLEMKSKHLEIECRRLDCALQSCVAENMALRQSLQFQNNRSCGAYAAKQESAVLFMESLLLGSLFWFVSLVCLFLVPSLRILSPNLKGLSWSRRDLTTVVAETKSRNSLMLGKDLKLMLLRLRRRCRSMRARMKFFLFPFHAVLA